MEHTTEVVTRLVFQLAVILIAAKIGGEAVERFFKMPSVLGELAAGIVIGPFALGGLDLPGVGPLFVGAFDTAENTGFVIPVSESLWSLSQVGAVVLLFVAGLETNMRQFLRYAGPATAVALGGVVLPFALGVVLTVNFGYASGYSDPKALIVGAVLMATSIGITARVLADLGSLNTPEGVTVMGAAVIDDVIGILALTIVVGISLTGEFSSATVGWVALKSVGFWIILTGGGFLVFPYIAKVFEKFQVPGSVLALSLSLALLAAGLAEVVGLAMIIGSFSVGLAMSGTQLAERLEIALKSIYAVLVPVFFVVMGMLLDLSLISDIWVFGLVITVGAVIGKILGSGLPALGAGFNKKGSIRIGVGMLPRGEVALIMAGVGISKGVIGVDLYGATVLMTIVTTVLAPPLLSLLFKDGMPGVRVRSIEKGE